MTQDLQKILLPEMGEDLINLLTKYEERGFNFKLVYASLFFLVNGFLTKFGTSKEDVHSAIDDIYKSVEGLKNEAEET